MEKIEIIKGNCPSKSNCYKIIKLYFKGRKKSSLGKTAELMAFESSFLEQCKHYKGQLLTSEFRFEALVYYSSKSPDLDNAFKVILDCLQKNKAIKNDNKCISIRAIKLKDKLNPRIEFRIIPLKGWTYSGGWELL